MLLSLTHTLTFCTFLSLKTINVIVKSLKNIHLIHLSKTDWWFREQLFTVWKRKKITQNTLKHMKSVTVDSGSCFNVSAEAGGKRQPLAVWTKLKWRSRLKSFESLFNSVKSTPRFLLRILYLLGAAIQDLKRGRDVWFQLIIHEDTGTQCAQQNNWSEN